MKWFYSGLWLLLLLGCFFFFAAPSAHAVPLLCKSDVSIPRSYSEAVDEWLILSKRNFKFDLGDVLLLPSAVGLRHMMTGVPDPGLSTLRAGLKAEEDAVEGWLAVSSSSRASVSPVVLLKLLVLDEEREMFGLPLLHSFSLAKGLSLLGQISGELGLDDVSDLTSWESGQISAGFWSLRVCLSDGVSVLEWRRGKRPERRFTGLFRGDLADNTGGVKVLFVHSLVLCGSPPPLTLAGTPPPTPGLL